ncbi:TlpA disulfide reductase family protein [Aquimarina sp. MMG016]|uniref:peroxiredoxin family protein n=1 Tax=Aquimarina sp. MMG016 TaxID=2822690 RepID=UPI001B39FB17|nr:TlpA disulfide reductase family protein [Aquimarina sp. MMG016]MBQ4821655.1 TlpA family protein disulfide reductase [Aquimarina sp. MMG016]
MKRTLVFMAMISLCNNYAQSSTEILNKTILKLNSLKTIEYNTSVKFLYKNEDENTTYKANCYFDFTSKDTLIGAKYHFVSEAGEQVFNGKQKFDSNNKNQRVLYENKPHKYQVNSSIFSLRSLNEIRTILPVFLKDATIVRTQNKDTIINNVVCYKFNFVIPNRYISEGDLTAVSENMKGYKSYYELVISKEEKLPVFVKTKNSIGDQVITVSLSDFNISATRDQSIWSYNRFPEGYLILSEREYFKRKRMKTENKIGQKAPYFMLPMIDGDPVSLSKLNNELILLEFWFPYCIGCVKAVPDINEIQEKYKEKGLAVYGIEFTKSDDKGLEKYIKKQKVNIPTLYKGKKTAASYGTSAAPTFYLLNKEKVILYVSIGLNIEELIKVIEGNIKG